MPSIQARMKHYVVSKSLYSLLLVGLICLPYFWLQSQTDVKTTVMTGPLPAFWPNSAWLYLALYPLMLGSSWLALERSDIFQIVGSLVLATVLAHLVFYLWPTSVQRPEQWGTSWIYGMLRKFDGARNACPSLHATYLVILFRLWQRFWSQDPDLRIWRGPILAIIGAIFLSTLTTHQHVPIDLVVGAGYGWLAWEAVVGLQRFRRRCA